MESCKRPEEEVYRVVSVESCNRQAGEVWKAVRDQKKKKTLANPAPRWLKRLVYVPSNIFTPAVKAMDSSTDVWTELAVGQN